MKKLNYAHGTGMSLSGRAGRLALALIFLSSMTLSPAVWAGAFIFAGEGNGVDTIAHPKGYTGTGGVLSVGVCIDPASLNANDLVIPVQNNIAVWNDLQPVASNIEFNAVNGLDVESVLLHEVGHCIGLAHVNAASESGLPQNQSDFTKATDGANNTFDIDAGPDGVQGSYDDIRGDDVNLHWFNPANDPFQLPIHTPVDTTQYKRDSGSLPFGDNFAQNASRQLASNLGLDPAEAVMQQLTYYNEAQRELVSDDASTIMLAASGLDETAGNADDYQLVLTYEGISDGPDCDINVAMQATSSFAYCSTGGSFVGNGHIRITTANIVLGNGYDWVFNTVPRGGGGGNQPPVAGNDSGTTNEDSPVDIVVLDNDSDPDSDPLDVTAVSNPPNGSASVNGDDTIRYTPDANYNGSDNFSYTVSDGNGGSDTANVSVTVNPVNDFPVAVDDSGVTTTEDTPVDIDVLTNDSDVDGDVLNVSAVTNASNGVVTNNGSYVTYQPNSGFTGQDSFDYTASDGNSGTDTATVTIDVQETPPVQPDLAVADFNTVRGTLSGSYLSTQAADGVFQSVTEFHSGGNKNRRYDTLEHIWQFNLTGGNRIFNLVAQGNFPGGDLDDAFLFQWSTSPNGGWQNMLTVPGGSSSFDVGSGVSGTVYVRVMDNDSTQRNTVYSTIRVDHMFFDGGGEPPPPPVPPTKAGSPNPGNDDIDVALNATLSWNAGDRTDTHDVYFGTSSGSLTLVSENQSGTSYNPGTLNLDTTYYWRIDEENSAGTTVGDEWSFTTVTSSSGPTDIVVDSISLGTVNAGKGRKHARAIVTVVDDLGNAVSGATVTGTFTGSYNQTVAGGTGGGNTATLTTTNNPQKRNISFTFCVDSITGVSGLSYSPASPDCQVY